MAIATLQRLLAVYDEHLGKPLPNHHPSGVLAILCFLEKCPATQTQLVKRTGLGQSEVSKLLKKFREKKLQFVEPRPARNQKESLTETGRQRVAELDAALATMLATIVAEGTPPVQAATTPEDPSAHTTRPSPKTDEQRRMERFQRNFAQVLEEKERREKRRRTAP